MSGAYAAAWRELRSRPICIAPAVAVAGAAVFALPLVRHAGSGQAFFSDFFGVILWVQVRIVACLLTMAGTIACANAVTSAARAAGMALLLALIAFIAATLLVATFTLSVLTYAVLFLYALPLAARGMPVIEAVLASFRIAAGAFASTAGAVAILVCAGALGSLAAAGIGGGWEADLAQWLPLQLAAAYCAFFSLAAVRASALPPAQP